MTFTLVVGNTHDDAGATVQIASAGHYIMFNEGRTRTRVALKGLTARGFGAFYPPGAANQNPHAWRTSKFRVLGRTSRTIMVGGHVGLRGMAVSSRLQRRWNGHRVGPSRGASAQLVQEVGGRRVLFVGVHLMARSFTKNKWRRPLFNYSVKNLAKYCTELSNQHPGIPIFVGGDTNSPIRIPLPGNFKRLDTLPDMGRAHYTQLYLFDPTGKVRVSRIREQHNASDHDAVVVDVNLGAV